MVVLREGLLKEKQNYCMSCVFEKRIIEDRINTMSYVKKLLCLFLAALLLLSCVACAKEQEKEGKESYQVETSDETASELSEEVLLKPEQKLLKSRSF